MSKNIKVTEVRDTGDEAKMKLELVNLFNNYAKDHGFPTALLHFYVNTNNIILDAFSQSGILKHGLTLLETLVGYTKGWEELLQHLETNKGPYSGDEMRKLYQKSIAEGWFKLLKRDDYQEYMKMVEDNINESELQ